MKRRNLEDEMDLTPGAAVLGDAALRQKFEAAREETFRGTMALRRK